MYIHVVAHGVVNRTLGTILWEYLVNQISVGLESCIATSLLMSAHAAQHLLMSAPAAQHLLMSAHAADREVLLVSRSVGPDRPHEFLGDFACESIHGLA